MVALRVCGAVCAAVVCGSRFSPRDIPERPLSLAFARSRQFCSRDKRVFGIGSETAVKMQ
jgi:hypothetical protein